MLVMCFCSQVEDPLTEATKYLKLLQNNSSDSLETHLLSFELNMRKQKVLLAFQVCLLLSTSVFLGYSSLLFFPFHVLGIILTIKILVCLIIFDRTSIALIGWY
jgi:hypothetical protein